MTSYYGENNYYGNFQQIAWAPVGTNRYTFFSGPYTSNLGINATSAADNAGLVSTYALPTGTARTDNTFISSAAGNIDTDATIDWWTMDQERVLTNVATHEDVVN
jgi:hypothetical protein